MQKQTKWLILIFCLGLILRLFFAVNSPDPIISDGVSYDALAVSLANGRGFSLNGQDLTSSVPPGFPFVLASIYALFGHNFMAALIVQAILGAVLCLLVYQLAKGVVKDKTIALVSAAICCVYYYFLREGERLLTEPLFMFLLVLSVLYYVKMSGDSNLLYPAMFGLSCALLTLTRPVGLFLPFILLGIELLRVSPRNKTQGFAYLKRAGIILLVFMIPLGLWAGRNFLVHKELVLVTTNGGANFYESFNPYQGKKYGITVKDQVTEQADKISSEVARDKFYFKQAAKSISSKSPAELFKLTLLKAATFWSLLDWGAMGNGGYVFNFCTAFILPFSLAAVILLRKDKFALSVLLTPLSYFFLLSLVFMGLPRFRFPAEPFLIILAAYSIVRLFRRFSRKTIPAAVVFTWLGLNLWMFINSEAAKGLLKKIAKLSGLW
ncbi:ArnT family glycosyltransferase [Candidatus Omnitrophota bacterium]